MFPLYREIEHTGDLAVVVEGADLADLFARAALSLFALLVEDDSPESSEERHLAVGGADRVELLHEWLSSLLSDFYADCFIATRVEIAAIDSRHVDATLFGHLLEPGKTRVLREIKAVTYHELSIQSTPTGLSARITFDV